MERSEPALVPEWLKTNGGTGSNNQFAPSLLHSDDHRVSKHVLNRPSASISDRASSYFRQSSSGNSDRDQRYNDYPDTPLPSKLRKYTPRRLRSSLTDRRGEPWPMKVTGDYKNSNKINYSNGGSLLAGVSVTNVPKSAFERDFPSLGTEERKASSEIGRVSSPGLTTAIQSLPLGTSALIGSDGWTSALVEVHGAIESNGTNVALPQQTLSRSSSPMLPSLTTSLNMAETVAQSPSRAGTPELLSVETQKREELVLRQSKQLIPMTPSLAKTQVLSPKIGQQHASNSVNLTLRGGPAKFDAPKTSLGKLQVLKPSRELNGVYSTAKEILSPTNGSRVVNSPLGTPSSAGGSIPFRNSHINLNFTSVENKPMPKPTEKKPSAQTKSRNDFFNLLKKKSSTPSPSAGSPPELEKHNEVTTKIDPPSVASAQTKSRNDFFNLLKKKSSTPSPSDGSPPELEKHNEVTTKIDPPSVDTLIPDTSSGNGNEASRDAKNPSLVTVLPPDEEEAALLHSLGWEEGSGEDEGLTEEEINKFYELYPSFRPSMKLHGGAANNTGQLNFSATQTGLTDLKL